MFPLVMQTVNAMSGAFPERKHWGNLGGPSRETSASILLGEFKLRGCEGPLAPPCFGMGS